MKIRQKYFKFRFFYTTAILVFILFVSAFNPVRCVEVQKNRFKHAKDDFQISPYTGYTREHWLEITEQIIAGVLPYLNPETGMPKLPDDPAEPAYAKIRDKNPKEEGKRALERIMMAVIIYTKATGNDHVPGYDGSISAPFIKAIIRGTNPGDPIFWGDPLPNDQVGSAFALAAYLNPEVFWDPLSQSQKKNILNYLQKQVFNETYDNNHYLFHMVPVALLEKYGYDTNREHLTHMFERLLGWYHGNGWFIDGNNGGFDHYNLWGFQLFLHVLDKFDSKWHAQFGSRIKSHSTHFFEMLPYLFGRDGGPIPWGRSLSYRFAGISSIGWAVLDGTCTLEPGLARRIASGELKYFWEHGCLGENNLLNIGYWGANASVAESYLSPGDPYWTTHGLVCLLIPEGDPFWTAVEQHIPADGTGGKIAIPGAQFSIRVSPLDGEARLFPAGQPFSHGRERWQSGIKYDQYSYSSYLGFCTTGEGGSAIGAERTGYSSDGNNWNFCERSEPVMIGDDHIISTFSLDQSHLYKITAHTLIGNDGEVRLFWHDFPEPLYLYMGGYGINVQTGSQPAIRKQENEILIYTGEFFSVLRSVSDSPSGTFETDSPAPREGWTSTHLFGGKGAFPYWSSRDPVEPLVPVIIYTNGTRNRRPLSSDIKLLQSPGLVRIRFEGKWYDNKIPF